MCLLGVLYQMKTGICRLRWTSLCSVCGSQTTSEGLNKKGPSPEERDFFPDGLPTIFLLFGLYLKHELGFEHVELQTEDGQPAPC